MAQYPYLRLPFDGSSFAATTVNLGPQTASHKHRDVGNVGYGPCTDQAFGVFDYTKGGQVILHEPQLIIELRPGDVLIFPSACISHENIPIAENEERYSLIAYSAGALFLHRDQGFQSFESLRELDPDAATQHAAGGKLRWERGCAMYPTL